jgi:flagellin
MSLIVFNTFGTSSGASSSTAKTGQTIQNAFAQLSSGSRFSSASIDAAGLAIAADLSSSLASISQGARNASDTASALSIADGALEQVSNITSRLQEIAVTSANGVYSDQQRSALQNEYSALTAEIQRIGDTTSYNGQKLLDGSSISAELGGSSVNISGINLSELAQSVASQDVSTSAGAQNAVAALQNFSDTLTSQRGASVDAGLARLGSVQDTLSSAKAVTATALSQASDTDFASAISDLNRAKALQQYQVSALSSMNQLQASLIKELSA